MTLPEKERVYIAIDLKSFYASVECVERGLDPLRTNLVVADLSRTEKTICLAVSPSLKAYGIPGRARLFEVVQKVREVNSRRKSMAPGRTFTGQSWDDDALKADPSLALSYVTAPPRMAEYMKWSTRIYNIYLKYIAPEDIHVYSIDEVFMDVTQYLEIYKVAPSQLAGRIIRDVLSQTGITAAAGIAPNLYLCKVALDIVAKHVPQAVVGSHAHHGFLAGGERLCQKAGGIWPFYHGGCGKVLCRKIGGVLQRGTTVPAVWD